MYWTKKGSAPAAITIAAEPIAVRGFLHAPAAQIGNAKIFVGRNRIDNASARLLEYGLSYDIRHKLVIRNAPAPTSENNPRDWYHQSEQIPINRTVAIAVR